MSATLKLLADLNGDGDYTDALEDLTSYGVKFDIERGRDRDWDEFGAGSCRLEVNNTARHFNPRNSTTSPLYPGIDTGLPAQVLCFDPTVVVSYEGPRTTSIALRANAATQKRSQGFILPADCDAIEFWVLIKRIGVPVGNLWMEIWSDAAGVPSALLHTLASVNVQTITEADYTWYPWTLKTALTAGTYHIVLAGDWAYSGTHLLYWGARDPGTYAGGADGNYTGAAWANGTEDALFRVYRYRALFTGVLDKPVLDYWQDTATLSLVDGLKRLGSKSIQTAVFQSQCSGTIMAAILTAAAFGGGQVLDTGIDPIPFAGFDDKALAAIRDLEQAERSVAWLDGLGRLHWEDRHHRLKGAHLVSQATFTQRAEQGQWELRIDDVVNEATVTANPAVLGTTLAEVYSMGHKLTIPAGETVTFKVKLSALALGVVSPSDGEQVDACDAVGGWTSPVNVLSLDNVTFREGTGSLKSVGSDADDFEIATLDFDLNGYTEDDWLVCDFWAEVAGVVHLYFGNGAAYSDYWVRYNLPVVAGWNTLAAQIGDCTEVGTPSLVQSINWFRNYQDKGGVSRTSRLDNIRLVKGADLIANTAINDSGDNIGGFVVATVTAYAKTAELSVRNDYSQTAYVTTLKLRGYTLATGSIEKTASDPTSQAKYGERSGSYGGDLLSNPNSAQALADWLVETKKDPPDVFPLQITADQDDATLHTLLGLDISDRVTVVQAEYDLSADFFIEGMNWQTGEGGCPLTVTLRLSKCPTAESLFIVGTSKFSDGCQLAF